jgi:plasmid stabilization system protein ParE
VRPAVLALLALALAPATASALTPPSNPRVSFDRSSLKIDGKRVVINSGEVHYSRMPDPREWPGVLARLKASGLNAVSIYVPWNYHEYAPGRFRYDGRYDVERFLGDARDAGLYVVVRHGPYVQGEMDAGGFPPWLLGRPGVLRTTDPRFTAAWKAWNASLLPRVARWELGGARRGTVIALQIENEYPGDGADPDAYMSDQYEDARRDGVTVPILHNNQQLLGVQLAPRRFGSIVDLFAFDSYPYGFTCCKAWNTQTFSQVDQFEDFYRQSGGATRSPLYIPEVQGGIAPIGGDDGADGEDRYRRFEGYATVQGISLLGQGLTMINQYMAFGGTTWGYTPFPNLGTSYDYAAPIREWTGLGRRFEEQRRLGLQIAAAAPSLAATERIGGSFERGVYAVRRSLVDGALHIFLRNADAGTLSPRVNVAGVALPPVPLPPQSARYLLAKARVGSFYVAETTAEVVSASQNVLVLFGDRGSRYTAVVDGKRYEWTAGKARAVRTGAKKKTLVFVDRFAAARVWTRKNRILFGPALVTPTETLYDRTTSLLSLVDGRSSRRRVTGPPKSVRLPKLTDWRFKADTAEKEPAYDDASWTRADRQSTTNQQQPLTRPILDADTYAQPTGFVWYRGRFTGAAAGVCLEGRHRYAVWLNGRYLKTVTSAAEIPGPNGLGGLGGVPPQGQPAQVAFPADALRPGENVLAVLTDDWGHTMDAAAANQAKQMRGLISAALDRLTTNPPTPPCGFTLGGPEFAVFGQRSPERPVTPGVDGGIDWRLRGGRPEDYPNASGLGGERAGFYEPRFDDAAWTPCKPGSGPIACTPGPGEVGWYRTSFAVKLPKGVEAPLGLELPRSGMPAEIFLNGVHVARAGRDRATRFVLPPGLLRTGGKRNVLAIARWAVDGVEQPLPKLVTYELWRRG